MTLIKQMKKKKKKVLYKQNSKKQMHIDTMKNGDCAEQICDDPL